MLSPVGPHKFSASVSLAMLVSVEIVYATADRQELIQLQVEHGTTVVAAIALSSIASMFPDDSLQRCPVGIWGRLVEKTQVLQDGDRIELYRNLRKDPREARRERADSD